MKAIKRVFLIIPFLFIQCEKDKAGYGNYIISIRNYTQTSYFVEAKLDGVVQGSFFIEANYAPSWSYTSPCDDLVQSAGMDNVRIFTYVSNGTHTFELINNGSQTSMYSTSFDIEADECIHQPLIID